MVKIYNKKGAERHPKERRVFPVFNMQACDKENDKLSIMNYKEQIKEIEKLSKSIVKKSKKFIRHPDILYMDDLFTVIKDLKVIDDFLK